MKEPNDLAEPVLASVSRSFYLTIRMLPRQLRSPVGLAYLLARASDTIADSATASKEIRLVQLERFGGMIEQGSTEGLAELRAGITADKESENRLLASLDRCLEWLAALPEADRREIRDVMRKIIRGQSLDLQRFPGPEEEHERVVALQTPAELEEYTYLVAGCVGEFWTKICMLHLPRYSRDVSEEFFRNAVRFGQGLQLVNILRDLPDDLRHGRCYLPEEELRASGASAGDLRENPQAVRPVFERWLGRAEEYLGSGQRYIEAVRNPRVRAGCFLPWLLGLQTLQLVAKRPPLEAETRVKVSRGAVYRGLALAMPAAFSNAIIRSAAKAYAVRPVSSPR